MSVKPFFKPATEEQLSNRPVFPDAYKIDFHFYQWRKVDFIKLNVVISDSGTTTVKMLEDDNEGS